MSSTNNGISESWEVIRKHESFFTGGKIVVCNYGGDDSLSSSSSSSCIASWNDGDVCLVDINTSEVLCTIPCDEDSFTSFCVHPHGNEMVTVGRSLLMTVWDLSSHTPTPNIVRQWRSHTMPVLDMCYDPSGTLVASACTDRSVRVWDVAKGFCTHSFRGHSGMVARVFFRLRRDVLQLVSCADTGEMRVYDLNTRQHQQLSNHMSGVRCVAYAPTHHSKMVSVGRDNIINVWNVDSETHVYTHDTTIPAYEQLESVHFVDHEHVKFGDHQGVDGAMYFVTAGEQGVLRVWQMLANKVKCVYKMPLPVVSTGGVGATIVYAAMYDGSKLLVATGDHNVFIFETSVNPWKRMKCLVGFNDEIVDVRCVPDSHHAIVVTNSEHVRVLNWSTFDADLLTGHNDIVLCVEVSNDGNFIVTGSKDHDCRVWRRSVRATDDDDEMPRFVCIAVATGHTEAVSGVAWSRVQGAREGRVFMVSCGRDRTLKQWNGSHLLCTNDQDGDEDDVSQLPVLRTVLGHDKEVNTVAVSPDDRLIASGSQDKLVKLWNSNDLSNVATLSGHKRGVWRVAFSPVDKVVASTSGDKSIKLWSITDYTCLKTFDGHTSSVLNVRFISSGMQLLSVGSDAVVKLWTIRTNECVASFSDDHDAKVWALDVTPDQQHMITGGVDSVVNVWNDNTAEQRMLRAKADATRVLQEQKLSTLLRDHQYGLAVQTAIDVEHPRQLFKILSKVVYSREDHSLLRETYDDMSVPVVDTDDVLRELSPEQLVKLLRYVREWNTNARKSAVANRVLHRIFQLYTPKYLMKVMRETNNENLVSAMVGYTQRHYERVARLMRKAYLLDFTYQAMALVSPLEDDSSFLVGDADVVIGGGGGVAAAAADDDDESEEDVTMMDNNNNNNNDDDDDDDHMLASNWSSDD